MGLVRSLLTEHYNMDKIIPLPLQRLVIFALALSLPLQQSTALTDLQCSTLSSSDLWTEASSVADKATEKLLADGRFERVVDGFAFLATGSDNCNGTGGGTNCDGFYVTYGFDQAALPQGVCEDVPRHPTDCGDVKAKLGLCGLCMGPASTPIGDNVTFTANFVLGPADAVAWFGCTPPPSEYFGWDPIINARLNESTAFYPGTNFGNALSFRRTNTSAATATDDTDGTDGTNDTDATAAPFAQPALVVHTADGAAAAAVAGAFTAAPEDGGGGVAPEAVSTHALDAREIKFMKFFEADDWRSAGPDLLSMVFRATLPLEGHEDAFDRDQAAVFPVRLFVGAAGAAAGEALTPDVFPRETTAATTAGAASPPPRPSPPLSAAARSFKGQQELPTEAALLGEMPAL